MVNNESLKALYRCQTELSNNSCLCGSGGVIFTFFGEKRGLICSSVCRKLFWWSISNLKLFLYPLQPGLLGFLALCNISNFQTTSLMTQKGKGGRSPKDPIGSVKISIHTNSWTSFTLMPEDGQQCELHGSLYSLISCSTCDPQAQPWHMMLLIYLMSKGGKKHTKSGVKI